jgi:hypothetical protein
MEKPNGHEHVSGQELTDQKINALKELSDVRFKASETAVNTALATQEKAVNAAFLASEKALTAALSASEKAISKAEANQAEVNKIIADIQKDVISLRESRSQGSGKDAARGTDKAQTNWVIGLLVSNALAFCMLAYKMLIK